MREIILFVASLAAAAVLTALAVIRPESPLWKPLLWGGIAIFAACACIWLFDYLRPGAWPPFLFGAGIGVALFIGCGIALFDHKTVDDEFMWFRVEISNPSDLTALLPLKIKNAHPGPFANVDVWFSPWSSIPGGPEYYSIGQMLKVGFPVLQHGDYPYGRAIHSGDYRIEFDGTRHDLTYHFVERLNISERDSALIQSIEVRRTIGGKDEKVVFSSYDWRP